MTFADYIFNCPVVPVGGRIAFPERVGTKGHDANGVPLYRAQDKYAVFFNAQRGAYLWYAINEGGVAESPVQCPKCRYIDDVDCFDVMGADDDNVFCPLCHTEFDPSGINHISQCIECGDWINTYKEAQTGIYCQACGAKELETR
jgi:DNA-directed RNA polymerase subunit RPC12/RpoP